ncbi:hypothetical protein [Deinococcus detaillensis]|uniref:hypothetical protein n=1 Tax=Deinococcus detaillensis TaxID=2592048 RepID=UPI00163DA9BF|nr:hypothetical protein [Deinococcus detaillensis]
MSRCSNSAADHQRYPAAVWHQTSPDQGFEQPTQIGGYAESLAGEHLNVLRLRKRA